MSNRSYSILVPAYKKKYLKEAIDSVLCQTYPLWELIIVNDASPEDLSAIVEQYSDPRIQYYTNSTNIGRTDLVAQWNKCLSYAKGDFVICMGDDDKLLPNALEIYDKLIHLYPQVNVVHGQTQLIDASGSIILETHPRPQWESALSLLYNRTFLYKHQYVGDFCYKVAPLRDMGGFYPLPLAWGSDDITAIQAAIPYGIVSTSEIVFQYRNHKGTISRNLHTFTKLLAVWKEAKWKFHFLRNKAANPEDEKLRRILQRNLLPHTIKKSYYLIYNATHTN